MPVNVICRHCGYVRQLSVGDIRTGSWRWKPCPCCKTIERTDDQQPQDAA